MAENGGARPNAGRKPGSKNKVPSKSLQAQQRFADLVAPVLEDLFDVLFEIAIDPLRNPKDRINAVRELLDRGMGRSREFIEVSTPEENVSAQELLQRWHEESCLPADNNTDDEDSADADGAF